MKELDQPQGINEIGNSSKELPGGYSKIYFLSYGTYGDIVASVLVADELAKKGIASKEKVKVFVPKGFKEMFSDYENVDIDENFADASHLFGAEFNGIKGIIGAIPPAAKSIMEKTLGALDEMPEDSLVLTHGAISHLGGAMVLRAYSEWSGKKIHWGEFDPSALIGVGDFPSPSAKPFNKDGKKINHALNGVFEGMVKNIGRRYFKNLFINGGLVDNLSRGNEPVDDEDKKRFIKLLQEYAHAKADHKKIGGVYPRNPKREVHEYGNQTVTPIILGLFPRQEGQDLERGTSFQLEKWLGEKKKDRTLIVATLGSMRKFTDPQKNVDFFKKTLENLNAGKREYALLLINTFGADSNGNNLESDVYVTSGYIYLHDLYRDYKDQIGVVVSHGGMGTTVGAAMRDLRVVVLHQLSEQVNTAKSIKADKHKLQKVTSEKLADKIRKTMSMEQKKIDFGSDTETDALGLAVKALVSLLAANPVKS